MTSTRRTLPRLVGLLAIATGTLAACGAGDDDGAQVASLGTDASTDDTSADGSVPTDPEDAMLAYSQCMRDHGIDMPDPEISEDGGRTMALGVDPRSDDFVEAQEACEPLMKDAFGDIEIDPEQEAEMRQQMLDYAACMRDHGVDMPDPVFDGSGTFRVDAGEAIDLDDDAVAEANETCAVDGGPGVQVARPADGSSDGPSVQVGGGPAVVSGGDGS